MNQNHAMALAMINACRGRNLDGRKSRVARVVNRRVREETQGAVKRIR